MTTISLAVTGNAVGPTSALVAPTQFYPIMVSVVFDYATGGQAVVQNQNTPGGDWGSYGTIGTLTASTSFFITSPVPGLRLNVTHLTSGQIGLSLLGANDGSIQASPTSPGPPNIRGLGVTSEDIAPGQLISDTTGLPLVSG